MTDKIIICGITKDDILNYLEDERHPNLIPEDDYPSVLDTIESFYDHSGEGLHGWKLIDHVINYLYPKEA